MAASVVIPDPLDIEHAQRPGHRRGRSKRRRIYSFSDALERVKNIDAASAAAAASATPAVLSGRVIVPHKPDILALSCDAFGVDGMSLVDDQGPAPTSSRVPMRFSVHVAHTSGQVIKWAFFQGADPYFFPDRVRKSVEATIRPCMVVRLNRVPHMDGPHRKSKAISYGKRCGHLFYVSDLKSDVLSGYGTRTKSATEVHALALVGKRLFQDLLRAMYHYTPQHKRHLETPSIYVHCHDGLGRSRYFFEFLHAMFYVVAATQSYAPTGDSAMEALGEWAVRQGQMHSLGLSLGQLLSPVTPMFKALTHTLAVVFDKTSMGLYALLLNSDRAAVRAPSDEPAHAGMACSAGPLCYGDQRQHPRWLCLKCHDAFFCSIECLVVSNHASEGDGPCPRLYVPSDGPLYVPTRPRPAAPQRQRPVVPRS